MAFPVILQKLFENLGAGPLLKRSVLPTATATQQGAVTVSDSVSSTAAAADGVAASPAAVKQAYERADCGLVIVNGKICVQYEEE